MWLPSAYSSHFLVKEICVYCVVCCCLPLPYTMNYHTNAKSQFSIFFQCCVLVWILKANIYLPYRKSKHRRWNARKQMWKKWRNWNVPDTKQTVLQTEAQKIYVQQDSITTYQKGCMQINYINIFRALHMKLHQKLLGTSLNMQELVNRYDVGTKSIEKKKQTETYIK